MLLYVQFCDSCTEDSSNHCEADWALVDGSNGTHCMPYPTLHDQLPRSCRLTSKALIKSYSGTFDQIKEHMHVEAFLKEKTLVHGVLASPLKNAEPHNLKHPEDGVETSCARVYVT